MTLPISSSINNYGSGVLVDAVPLVDPTSELGAAALNPLRNDVSAMTMVAPRLIFQFTGSATVPFISSSTTWTSGLDSVWGNSNSYYPTLSRPGQGLVNVTLVSSVPDQIGNTNLVNVRAARATVMSGTSPCFCHCAITSANAFTVHMWNSGASTSDFAGSLFFVEVF